MEKFSKINQRNIRLIFEEKTGVDLNPSHRVRPHRRERIAVLAAMLALVVLTTVSCQKHIFSPLSGDRLALDGSYQGEGIVEVTVTNNSDMELELQKQTRLMCWATAQEVPRLDGTAAFEGNTEIAPHSSETLRLDLSEAYDMAKLEAGESQVYYLLLTNQDFLFGQDWMLSFRLGQWVPETTETAKNHTVHRVEEKILQNIAPALRFYFEDSYYDEAPRLEEQHVIYQEKVRKLLLSQEKHLVMPVDLWLTLEDVPEAIVFDENVPREWRYAVTDFHHTALDGYQRIVGSQFDGAAADRALQLGGQLPGSRGQYGDGTSIPLIYLFAYPKLDIHSMEDCTFIYGQLISFGALEKYKVYEDDLYVIYDATDLFYRDLDRYIDDFLSMREDVYFDDAVRSWVHGVYDYYHDPENLSRLIVCHSLEENPCFVPSPAE